MRSVRFYLTNPFRSGRKLSWADYKRFSEEHLGRISNPGAPAPIAALVAATAAAHAAVFGKLNNKAVAGAVQQAMTRANDLAMKDFFNTVRRKEAAILSKYGKDTAEYEEFFPYGMEQYRNMTKGNAGPVMEQIVSATNKYATDLEAGLGLLLKTKRDAVVATRESQLEQKGVADDTADSARHLRAALEDVHYDNLLAIGRHFKGDAEAGMVYFDESMISNGGSDEGDGSEEGEADEPAPPQS